MLTTICYVGHIKFYVQPHLTIIVDILICSVAELALKCSYLILHSGKNMIPSGVNFDRALAQHLRNSIILCWTRQMLCPTKPDLNCKCVTQSSCVSIQILLFDLPHCKTYDIQQSLTLKEHYYSILETSLS